MTPRVVVVGLGPAGPDLVTAGTRAEIASHEIRFLRTSRHPAASIVAGATSFDSVYESANSMEAVYLGIVEELARAAVGHGEVLYAVPGSPLVAEHTVELLLGRDDVATTIHPALSFLDLAWVRLGIDPVAEGVRVVDGHRFGIEAAGERGPLLVAQCDRTSVLSDIKLAVEHPPAEPVTVVSRLGAPDELVVQVEWSDLDRVIEPDHLTSLWIPRMASPVSGELAAFDDLVLRLRAECPWDREQTHRSLTRYLVEEAYEVVDVLDELPPEAGSLHTEVEPSEELDDLYLALEEELGDLLFQVVLHSRLAAEAGRFDLSDVVRGIHDKLVVRHPHVFGHVDVDGDPRRVESNWERIKADSTRRESAYDGIPRSLPALARASKLLERAGRAGVDVAVAASAQAEVADLGEALGEAVLALVAAAPGTDPEEALRLAAGRLEERLRGLEGSDT